MVRNVYTFKLINKTHDSYENLELKLLSHDGQIEVVGGEVKLPESDLFEGTLFIRINKKNLESSKEKIKIGIFANGELIEETSTNFSSPLQIKWAFIKKETREIKDKLECRNSYSHGFIYGVYFILCV